MSSTSLTPRPLTPWIPGHPVPWSMILDPGHLGILGVLFGYFDIWLMSFLSSCDEIFFKVLIMGTRITLTDGTRIFSLWTLFRVRWCFHLDVLWLRKTPYDPITSNVISVLTPGGVFWRGCYLGKWVVFRHQKHLSSHIYWHKCSLLFKKNIFLKLF